MGLCFMEKDVRSLQGAAPEFGSGLGLGAGEPCGF
jgi:hypothetical protein